VKYHLILALSAIAFLAVACGQSAATPSPAPTPTSEAVPITPGLGAQIAREMGCSACHSIDGNPSVGPTWQGLFGRQRPLADGSTVTADEAYIRESILSPNAKIAQGFNPGIMTQDFSDKLSDADIQAIIEYIKSLR
jgi:mono/diheme cytochrome c family protein